MASEITQDEEDRGNPYSYIQDKKEEERLRIRQIIHHQKSLYLSSSSSSSPSSFSSAAASISSLSKSSSSLLDLMKEGSTSLRRLFDMEHTSLGHYFNDYSVSPIIRPILLWGSDSDSDRIHNDPWSEMRQIRYQGSFDDGDFSKREEIRKQRKLMRTKSYKRLPRFSLWRCGRFKFRLRLIRKIRLMIRGRIF